MRCLFPPLRRSPVLTLLTRSISTIDPSPYAVLQAVQLIALQGFLVEHPPPIEEEQTSEDVPTTWHITEDGIHLALYLAASNTRQFSSN